MLRSFEFALETIAVIVKALLAMILIFFLFYPADSLGLWARIIGVGFALSIPFAALSLLSDIVARRPVNLVRPQLISAVCCLGSVIGYAAVAAQTETPLQDAIAKLKNKTGCMDVRLKGREPFTACYQSPDVYRMTYRVPQSKPLSQTVVSALRAAEDVRQPNGMMASDVQGTVHAVKSLGKIGGSNICQQASRLLLRVPRHGSRLKVLLGKARVFVGCSALDGMITRQDQMAIYAEEVPMGSIGPVDVHGLGAGAHVLFAKDLDSLSLGEAVTLAALINIPSGGFPLSRPGEQPGMADARRTRLRSHFDNIVANGVRHRLFTEQQADQMRQTFGDTFVNADQLAQILPPSIHNVRAEVLEHVPDAASRFLRVESDYAPAFQDVVVNGAKAGLIKVSQRLPSGSRMDVKADIAVVDAAGNEVAEINLARSYSDAGSVHKLLLYPFALETGCLRNMQQPILRAPAAVALATSDPKAAGKLVDCVHQHKYADFLAASAGWRVSNPALISLEGFSSIAMGSGVSATPLEVASTIRMYSSEEPGILVQPSFCSSIVDAGTGAVLFKPDSRRLFRPRTAGEITAALKLTAKIGTTRGVLGEIAAQHSDLISKTGTPHFHKHGGLHGAGGAWLATGADGLFFGIRVTTTNGKEIPLDGATGAGLVGNAVYHELFNNIHAAERKVR